MNKFANELLGLPDVIQALELQLLENFGKKAEAEAASELMKAQVDQVIAEEVGEDGKAKYGNEFKRKSESIRRLAENLEYGKVSLESSELLLSMKRLEIKLRFYQNKLKVLASLAQGKYLEELQ